MEPSEIRKIIPTNCHEAWDALNSFKPENYFNPEKMKTLFTYKGHTMQPGFGSLATSYAYEKWSPKESDVLVAAFPKTGLNWTTEIIKQLLFYKDEVMKKVYGNLPMTMALLEGGNQPEERFKIHYGLPAKRQLTSTHLPATCVNVEKMKRAKAKIVYVVRNPKDQAVSWFKFIPKLPHLQAEPFESIHSPSDWSQFLKNYTEGKMPLGMKETEWYPDHILSWLPYRDDETVLFVHYEDMKRDLFHEVARIAKFLDLDLSADELRKVAHNCEFSVMKKSKEEGNSQADMIARQLCILRKGEVGDWKNHFTVSQSEMFDAIMEEKFAGQEFHFRYKI